MSVDDVYPCACLHHGFINQSTGYALRMRAHLLVRLLAGKSLTWREKTEVKMGVC